MMGTYSKAAVRTGWLIAILFFIQSVMTIFLPRTDKTLPLREDLRNWHVLIGCLLLGLVIYRLMLWWKQERGMTPPADMRPGLFNWSRVLALTTYVLFVLLPIFGFLFAWAGGTVVSLGPLFKLPALLPESYRLWLFAGYFHSGTGFMMLLLTVATLLTAAYAWLRYGKGLISAFPPGYGVQALLYMLTSSWALATFRSNAPGPAAVARFLAVVAVVWALGWWLQRRRVARTGQQAVGAPVAQTGGQFKLASVLGAIALVAAGSYGPYAMFRLSPFPMGDVIAAPDGVTSHDAPVTRVQAWAETEFERKVASDTYKWCGFCHTYKKGEQTKAGPNLHAIFGQRIGAVPNFHYTPALAEMRNAGRKWDDAALDAFLADPDKFAPGTTMVISSGPVTDPKVRRAVINMLKRDTMQGAIDTIPAPPGQ